jgi:hypothetical protein
LNIALQICHRVHTRRRSSSARSFVTDDGTLYPELGTAANIEAIEGARKMHNAEYWGKFEEKDKKDVRTYQASETRVTAKRDRFGAPEISFISTPPSADRSQLSVGSVTTRWTIQDGTFQYSDAQTTPVGPQRLSLPPDPTARRPPSPLRNVDNVDSAGGKPRRRGR